MSIYLGNLELATGGGATGTGLPVNTYESFSVSLTGNPSGYSATTGLYTHPNGDYWLKTGNNISDSGGNYPAATFTFSAPVQTGVSFTGPAQSTGIFVDANNVYVTEKSARTLGTYTKAGGFLGSFGTVFSPYGNYFDGTNFYIVNDTNKRVDQFTSAGVATGVNFATGTADPRGITSDGTFWYLTDIAAQIVTQYTLAGVATGFTFSTSGGPSGTDLWSISYYDGFLYVSGAAGTVVTQYTLTGVATGFTFNLTGGIANTDGTFWYSTAYSNTTITQYDYQDKLVGDGTARTDADSGQPLFIKIK